MWKQIDTLINQLIDRWRIFINCNKIMDQHCDTKLCRKTNLTNDPHMFAIPCDFSNSVGNYRNYQSVTPYHHSGNYWRNAKEIEKCVKFSRYFSVKFGTITIVCLFNWIRTRVISMYDAHTKFAKTRMWHGHDVAVLLRIWFVWNNWEKKDLWEMRAVCNECTAWYSVLCECWTVLKIECIQFFVSFLCMCVHFQLRNQLNF